MVRVTPVYITSWIITQLLLSTQKIFPGIVNRHLMYFYHFVWLVVSKPLKFFRHFWLGPVKELKWHGSKECSTGDIITANPSGELDWIFAWGIFSLNNRTSLHVRVLIAILVQ